MQTMEYYKDHELSISLSQKFVDTDVVMYCLLQCLFCLESHSTVHVNFDFVFDSLQRTKKTLNSNMKTKKKSSQRKKLFKKDCFSMKDKYKL